jgi:hypothetical protein
LLLIVAIYQYYESINDISKGRQAKGEFMLKGVVHPLLQTFICSYLITFYVYIGASIYKLPPQDDQPYCFQISCRKANGETDEYQFHAINEKHFDIWLQFLSSVARSHVIDPANTKTDSRKPFSNVGVSSTKQPIIEPLSGVYQQQQHQQPLSQRFSSASGVKSIAKVSQPASRAVQEKQLPFSNVDEISPVPNKRPAFAVLPTKIEPPKQSALLPGSFMAEFPVSKESIILSRILLESLEERGRLAAVIEKLSSKDSSVLSSLSENDASLKLRGMTIELQRVVDQLVEAKIALSEEKRKRGKFILFLFLSLKNIYIFILISL